MRAVLSAIAHRLYYFFAYGPIRLYHGRVDGMRHLLAGVVYCFACNGKCVLLGSVALQRQAIAHELPPIAEAGHLGEGARELVVVHLHAVVEVDGDALVGERVDHVSLPGLELGD